jgi:hypothetical protein
MQLRVKGGEIGEVKNPAIDPICPCLRQEQRLLMIESGVQLGPQLGRIVDL